MLRLPSEWATLLAENLLIGPSSYSAEAGRSAAKKIELRLTDDDRSPVEFDSDEAIEVLKALNAVCTGWHKSESGAWEASAAHAFYWGFEGSAGGPTGSLDP